MVSHRNNEPVHFALIGVGGIAQAYMQAFAKSESASLVAVLDVRQEAAEEAAAATGAQAFSDIDALLAGMPDLDAAIVCTPPNTHEEICCALLESSIHVLCEKPLSICSESAQRMRDCALHHGVILSMASKFRFTDDVQKAKTIVDAGTVGEVILFENAFTSYVDMSKRWNSVPEISGGGVLIDNGTHSLDIARYFLGPIRDIHVVEGKRSQNLPVEETVAIFFHSESGVMGSIDLSWTINKSLESFLNIHGTEGTISVGWRESKLRIGNGAWEVFGTGYDKIGSFYNQIENIAGAVRGANRLLVTAEDGIASVKAVEAAYAALKQDPWVKIDVPERAKLVIDAPIPSLPS